MKAADTAWRRTLPESTATRLRVRKTYKLFIGGAFPRSESGRTYPVDGDNVALASRKDARDAVVEDGGAVGYGAARRPQRLALIVLPSRDGRRCSGGRVAGRPGPECGRDRHDRHQRRAYAAPANEDPPGRWCRSGANHAVS